MSERIIAAAFFGALFYFGKLRLPQHIGFQKALKKGLDFISVGEIAEFGDVNTLLVADYAVVDEKGELDKDAIEIVTMLGQKNIQTVLMTTNDETAGDEMARRLGAVKTYYKTSDYMCVVKELEEEGKRVLYAENLWDAEEAVELGQTVKFASKTNNLWTVICGIGGVLTVDSIGIFIFIAINLLVLAITSSKIKKV